MRFPVYPLLFLLCFSVHLTTSAQELQTPFERDSNYSATYAEVLDHYEALADRFPENMTWIRFGETDSGNPLHLVLLSGDSSFRLSTIREREKTLFFVNNAIHAGEPCGVDAAMMWVRDLLRSDWLSRHPEIVVAVLPVYNIGGALNRNSHTRTNQNGPQAYGFRGNARNLDLNRDFIKADSRNARSFNQLFTALQPDVFLDTHTSNGADYQHVMTLIHTQPDKLGGALGPYLRQSFLPALYGLMEEKGWAMAPYMNSVERTPESGIAGFMDLPRYSSGYAALHQSLGFISEAHMLKPYAQRVRSTYDLLQSLLVLTARERNRIRSLRTEDRQFWASRKSYPIQWQLDRERADTFRYRGYRSTFRPSQFTGQDRLFYDRDQPFQKKIPVYDYYRAQLSLDIPVAYIVPQAYTEVIDRLEMNGVQLFRLAKDTVLELGFFRLTDFQTVSRAYEGHYLHYELKPDREVRKQAFRAGDFVVYPRQPALRYIVETLEPQAPDSYFSWNFFDGVLMQKEYFSSYVFEDLAWEYLQSDPRLRRAFMEKKASDPDFAASARAQLNWIYRRSPHYEPTHLLYPVGRLLSDLPLPLEK